MSAELAYYQVETKAKSWQPHAYQKKAMKFLIEHACGALFLDPGLGKTSITLGAIKLLKRKGLVTKVLLIAPLRPCYTVWPKEIQKWADFNGLKCVILHGPKKDLALQQEADIYIINPEGLDWLLGSVKTKTSSGKTSVAVDVKKFKKLGFDVLVIDELSKFKNQSTGRFKALKQVIHLFGRRWGLTGSPASNGLEGLFGQCFMLDQGRSLGEYITRYRLKYFLPHPSGFGWRIRPGAEDEIYERIEPLALRMAGEDYLELPELIVNNIRVDLPPAALKLYLQLEADLIASIEDKVITAATAGVASGKCIAEGTEILTSTGWKLIEEFLPDDLLWDGVEWVSAGRLQYNGYKDVINCDGVFMTPDHKVLTVSGWKKAQEIIDGKSSCRYDRESVRPHFGEARREWAVHQGKLQVCYKKQAIKQRKKQCENTDSDGKHNSWSSCSKIQTKAYNHLCQNKEGLGWARPNKICEKLNVYDIVNSGPRSRFTVRGSTGKVIIVHNCRQLANGGIYLDPIVETLVKQSGKRETAVVHNAKTEALADLVDELQGSPLLVAYDFHHDLERLRARFPEAVFVADYSMKEFSALEAKWNRGEISLMFGHAQSIGHGLNLQECGHHVAWYALTWNFEDYDQFIRRVYRQGNKFKKVFVHHIIAAGTIDEIMLMSLKAKDKTQKALFAGLQELAKLRKRSKVS